MKILKALLLTLRDTILCLLGVTVFIGVIIGILKLLTNILFLLGIVGKYIGGLLVISILIYGVYIIIIDPIKDTFKKHYNKIKESEDR